jgi:hypothetical protein
MLRPVCRRLGKIALLGGVQPDNENNAQRAQHRILDTAGMTTKPQFRRPGKTCPKDITNFQPQNRKVGYEDERPRAKCRGKTRSLPTSSLGRRLLPSSHPRRCQRV